MYIFILTLTLTAILMIAMAVGVIFKKRELKGSCGGAIGGDCACLDAATQKGEAFSPNSACKKELPLFSPDL